MLAGGLAALLLGSALPLVLAVPYLWMLVRGVVRWRGRAPLAAVGELLADAVGAAALLAGTVRYRSPVL